MSEPAIGEKKQFWFSKKENRDKAWRGLLGLTIILCLLDFVLHKHSAFKSGSTAAQVDEFWAFYGLFALAATFLLVLLGKGLRKLLNRSKNYYGGPDE